MIKLIFAIVIGIIGITIGFGCLKNSYDIQQSKIDNLTAEVQQLQEYRELDVNRFINYTEIVKQDFAQLEAKINKPCEHNCIDNESVLTVIHLICNWRDFPYEIACATALVESGLNPDLSGVNEDGTTDWGLYMLNDKTLKQYSITSEIALSPASATEYYIIIMNNLLEKCDGDLYYAFRCYQAGEQGANNGGGYKYADKMFEILGYEKDN